MKYLCLIYSDESSWEGAGEDDQQAMYAEYMKLGQEYGPTGKIVDGAQLEPTSAATSVRVRNTESLVTDGPFAETKEQLGGYYLFNAESLDEALEFAAKIPGARFGTIEVRPLVERSA